MKTNNLKRFMGKRVKLSLVFLLISGLCSCGHDYDWMNGDFEGTTRLLRSDYYSSTPELIRTGIGRINFGTPFFARLGGNTPLPDCNLKFVSEKEPFKYILDINGTEYRGETNDGKGCGAYLFEGEGLTPIDISIAEMSYQKDIREVVLNIKFNIKGDSYKNYQLEIRGRKKGWF